MNYETKDYFSRMVRELVYANTIAATVLFWFAVVISFLKWATTW